MRGLYAILNIGTLERHAADPLRFADAVIEAMPFALQVRAKTWASCELLALLRELGPRCRAKGVRLVVNDRTDCAVLGGCDMVHVGQDDMSLEHVRRVAPGVRVGISTHSPGQLERALLGCPDYIAYGPIFATTSKERPEPVVGLEGLREAHRHTAKAGVPLVAIGGVTQGHMSSLVSLCEVVAVIGALVPEGSAERPHWYEEVFHRSQLLLSVFETKRSEIASIALC